MALGIEMSLRRSSGADQGQDGGLDGIGEGRPRGKERLQVRIDGAFAVNYCTGSCTTLERNVRISR